MPYWWLIGGTGIIAMLWILFRGNKIIKARDRLLKENTRIENIDDKDVYYLSYHGGIPRISKPQKLYIALTNKYILFFNDKGAKEKIFFESCSKIDQFVTSHKPDLKGKSIVLWGPLAGLFLTVKFRYYIIIEYMDINYEKNNILFECNSNNHKLLYEGINSSYRKAKSKPSPRAM